MEIDTCSSGNVMTLAQAYNGRDYRVSLVKDEYYREQILRMGLAEGSRIACITSIRQGPVVIRHGRTDIAIGRGMAENIMVEPLAPVETGRGGNRHGILSPGTWFTQGRGSAPSAGSGPQKRSSRGNGQQKPRV